MLLLIIPFIPGYLQQVMAENIMIPVVAPDAVQPSVTAYLTSGYVGSLGYLDMPVSRAPQVLGVSYERAPAYRAQEVDRSHGVIRMNPEQAVTIWIDFENTGTTTWYNDGPNFVALNLTNPTNRTSQFHHAFWPASYRPAKLLQREVRPGEIGRFRIALQAPATPGLYQEHFHLVAENLAWIDGGYATIDIGVGQSVAQRPDYRARETERSQGGTIALPPGKAFTFWIDFENTGLKNWYNTGNNFIAVNVDKPIGRVSAFQHPFWSEYYYRPGRLAQSRIYSGERGRFYFALKAPATPGYYTESFALVAEHKMFIPGGTFTITFKVGNQEVGVAGSAPGEPTVRIGIYEATQPVTIVPSGEYTMANVLTGTSERKSGGTPVTIATNISTHWRIEPIDPVGVSTISSYENRPAWKPSLNDNTFRGAIEVRSKPNASSAWVINELPVESYLKGLAEVSNGQPSEYLKSLIVAARSYVLWHHNRGGKYPELGFDINAITDQVYRGYGFEQRSTDPLGAIQATAGTVITHPKAISEMNPSGIAVAAYSSGTDGRTRSYQEVWGGTQFPWLVSVADPYGIISNPTTLSGNHMVGMSANGARGYALNEQKTFDWILQHYYTGTATKKIY